MIEQSTRYILNCIAMTQKGDLMRAKPEAMTSCLWRHSLENGCDSWYQQEDGRIATLYPYNARTWRKSMRRVHVEDFEIKQVTS